MTLLDLLVNQSKLKLIVAHFNHGIRTDSNQDEKLVKAMAKKYDLAFEVKQAKLGPSTSEAKARMARYQFLERVQLKYHAKAIITAHHQDDLIETAFINLSRGTGRRGLSSLASNRKVIRPLLHYPKNQLIAYAKDHNLTWREDKTNYDYKYLRNLIRANLATKMTASDKKKMLDNIDKVAVINNSINIEIAKLSRILIINNQLNRYKFIELPTEVADEMLLYWLKANKIKELNRPSIKRLSMAIKTGLPNTSQVINKQTKLSLHKSKAILLTSV